MVSALSLMIAASNSMTDLRSIWEEAGAIPKGVAILLAFMTVMIFAILIVRFISFAKANRQSMGFADVASEALGKKDVGAVVEAAEQKEYAASHVARVVHAGLKEFKSAAVTDRATVLENVDRAVDRAVETERHGLSSGLGILATTASTAPYIGLFGTVFGIIHAFEGIQESGGGGLEAVAGGIAEALYATALGLFVAIFAVWFYNFLYGRLEQFEVDMNNSKLEIMSYVDKNRSRAGEGSAAAAESAG